MENPNELALNFKASCLRFGNRTQVVFSLWTPFATFEPLAAIWQRHTKMANTSTPMNDELKK